MDPGPGDAGGLARRSGAPAPARPGDVRAGPRLTRRSGPAPPATRAPPSRRASKIPAAAWLAAAAALLAAAGAVAQPPSDLLPGRASPPPGCEAAAYEAAAAYNAAAARFLKFNLFGREETGWEAYAPAAAESVGTTCPFDTSGFARDLARWETSRRLVPSGALDGAALQALHREWQEARGVPGDGAPAKCPPVAPPEVLLEAPPEAAVEGRSPKVEALTLLALEALQARARRELGLAEQDPTLRIFSAFRDPAADAARCAGEGNCQGLVRATCSRHRTGRAVDLFLGALPGQAADSSTDQNRLYLSRTAAYRWLVRHAREYGFRNYVFEPWHWERVEAPVVPSAASPP